MTAALRIDHSAKLCTWGRVEMQISDMHRIPNGFSFLGTPGKFVPTKFEIYPEQGRMVIDRYTGPGIEHRLIGWHVVGSVATAETRDVADDDGWVSRWGSDAPEDKTPQP